MEVKNNGLPNYTSYFLLQLSNDLLIKCLVLISMTLQLLLVFGGAFRHRCSSQMLALVVWLAYMSADAVAIYAVGTMVGSSSIEMLYIVWAPLFLLHLGGPDTITAYSRADNQLWLRHGFTMVFHILVVAYLISFSALEWKGKVEWDLLAAAILVFLAGSTKYGERTLALRIASYSQIVSSTQPIYEFMQHEHELGETEYNYIVEGEKLFHNKLRSENKSDNFEWSKDLLSGTVTVENVLEYEQGHVTDNYIVCVSRAFFKMYKRRFVSLRFHEKDCKKSRRFFFNGQLSAEEVFKIVEIEIKFVYDCLFSKSSGTAFSKWGMAMRVGNTCLLGGACFLIFPEKHKDELHGQAIVTYIVMSVALILEVFQLCRILVSDWTLVWLVCAHIRQLRKPRQRYTAILIPSVMRLCFI